MELVYNNNFFFIGRIYTRDELSRRIIHETNNSSKYKSEDKFWRIICLDIYFFIPGNIAKI